MATQHGYADASYRSSQRFYKNKWLIILVSVFLVVFILPFMLLAWMGFVPGVSHLLGSAYQKDLGVTYTPTDLNSYNAKTTVVIDDFAQAPSDPDTGYTSILAEPKTVNDLRLSQEEVTAAVNESDLEWLPVDNLQVRFDEGTIELSGMVRQDKMDDLKNYLQSNGYSNRELASVLDWIGRLPGDAPIYAKGTAEILNNNLTFRLDQAEIGNLSIPLGSVADDLSTGISTYINNPNFDATSAQLHTGDLIFTGTYPTVIYIDR